jgi:GNAT superfamily N-acetyltransferase
MGREDGKREMQDDFVLSTDKHRLDIETIHRYLSERSYWAKGRDLDTVRQSIAHSLCFGIYGPDDAQVGFARVVTDYAIFAFIMDVFVLEAYRGRGLGQRLIAFITNFPELKNLKRWQLVTDDAHGLYAQYGFKSLAAPQKHMEKVNNPAHRAMAADGKGCAKTG